MHGVVFNEFVRFRVKSATAFPGLLELDIIFPWLESLEFIMLIFQKWRFPLLTDEEKNTIGGGLLLDNHVNVDLYNIGFIAEQLLMRLLSQI